VNAYMSLPSAVTDFVTGSEPSFFLGCARNFQGKTFRPQVWKGLRVSEKNTHQEYFSNGPAAENPEQSVRRTGDTDTEQNQNSRQQASGKALYCNKTYN
ncbi:MAG: hypothetical protein IKF90_01615, partial [Parasporobacterium sp.]|nr:hypothetical protein [Parasporobacterium sp.]